MLINAVGSIYATRTPSWCNKLTMNFAVADADDQLNLIKSEPKCNS